MKLTKYRIVVYDWNPNGTNDIGIEGSYSNGDPRVMDGLSEALFGLNVSKFKKADQYVHGTESTVVYIPLKVVLKHIACSPVEDGSTTIKFLSKYFKSVGGIK